MRNHLQRCIENFPWNMGKEVVNQVQEDREPQVKDNPRRNTLEIHSNRSDKN